MNHIRQIKFGILFTLYWLIPGLIIKYILHWELDVLSLQLLALGFALFWAIETKENK